MSNRFMIFGHRGSPRSFPENTRASFDEALRAGADGFETDLRLLSDRTAVLYHDDLFGEDDLETLSAAEISARGGKLELVRDLVRYADRATMILEVKRSQWEDVLLALIGSWPNIVVASFDHATIRELARRNPPFPVGITWFGSIVGVAEYAARLGASWAFPNYHYVTADLVNSLHDRGITVVPWTPNFPREWDRLRQAGCDGIITDLPAGAVQWRDSSAR
jgi:glycerophosphoryl diester phosphodiesterase